MTSCWSLCVGHDACHLTQEVTMTTSRDLLNWKYILSVGSGQLISNSHPAYERAFPIVSANEKTRGEVIVQSRESRGEKPELSLGFHILQVKTKSFVVSESECLGWDYSFHWSGPYLACMRPQCPFPASHINHVVMSWFHFCCRGEIP